jgi:hypothetical protein
VVDPSLLRQAADRGVTICFADLDGADGLWVPEERTVLVNRRLSERDVAAVIEHELGHVAIDDQHADLDAGVGRPPAASSRRWAAALTAAACLAVIGGVTAGLARGTESAIDEGPVVAPSAPPLTAGPPGPGQVVTTMVIGPDGRLQVRTVTLTATPSVTTPAPTSAGTVAPTPTRGRSVPAPPPAPSATTAAPTTSPPADPTTPPVDLTTPPVSESPTTDAAGGTGDGLAGEASDTSTGTDSGSGGPPGTP